MTNPDHKNFYVSAIDGPRRFLVAGPYSSHKAALERVDVVRAEACDFRKYASAGRAQFMAWGTASSEDPHPTALGAFAQVTPSTTGRIGRLYEAWIGYNPISECGVTALEALQTLREYRAEGGAA